MPLQRMTLENIVQNGAFAHIFQESKRLTLNTKLALI